MNFLEVGVQSRVRWIDLKLEHLPVNHENDFARQAN
jgi:hypothetical protein